MKRKSLDDRLNMSLGPKQVALSMCTVLKYWYRQARERTFQEIKRTRLVSLKYLTGDHSLCCEDRCYALKSRNAGKNYQEPETNLCPEMYEREILQVLEMLNQYASDKRIREMMYFVYANLRSNQ